MQVRSQPVFFGKLEGPFCLSCTFIFRNERNWMKKSARVSEKLVSLGLPGLQVATCLISKMDNLPSNAMLRYVLIFSERKWLYLSFV